MDEQLAASISLPADAGDATSAGNMETEDDDGEAAAVNVGSLNGLLAVSDDGQWAAAISGSGAHIYNLDTLQVRQGRMFWCCVAGVECRVRARLTLVLILPSTRGRGACPT